jgi:uncharacterized protein with FMN-binding domain
MDMDTGPSFAPPPAPVDPLIQARLDRLAAARTLPPAPRATNRTTPPTGRVRRRHAAKRSRAAAVLMSITAAGGLSAYFQHADSAGASQTTSTTSGAAVAVTVPGAVAAASAPSTSTPSAGAAATASSDAASPATTTPAAAASTSLADGTFTGATDTNRWGPVQVEITVAGGRITNVVALQTPTQDRKSVGINQRATPTLASEALSAQTAQIDTVSGATYTSDSYKVSLQSAIDLARSAAATATAG